MNVLFPLKLTEEVPGEGLVKASSPRLRCVVNAARETDRGDLAQRSELPAVYCDISLSLLWPGLGAVDVMWCSRSSAPPKAWGRRGGQRVTSGI